jgi:3-hydroxybutyryl-CoA dehydrogenase
VSSASLLRPAVVGIAGAGVMGCAIAAEFARAGCNVVLYDIASDARDAAQYEVRRSLRTRALLRADQVEESPGTVSARVRPTPNIADLASCPVVIENISEDMPAKERFYRAFASLKENRVSLLVVNSSTVEIRRVAEWVGRGDHVIGVHFMNPVGLIDAVEVIASEATSAATLDTADQLLAAIGKTPLKVKDHCGYVSNRIFMLTVNEAIRTLADGVASAGTIDQVFERCFGWRSGPLATADLIGLDTVRLSLIALRQGFGDAKFTPAGLLDEMVASGRVGVKSGHGFYDYS